MKHYYSFSIIPSMGKIHCMEKWCYIEVNKEIMENTFYQIEKMTKSEAGVVSSLFRTGKNKYLFAKKKTP